MLDTTLWWSVAGAVIVIELLTGTFYLLMIALGLAAGAMAAHAALPMATQLLIAALVGAAGVLAVQRHKRKHPATPSAQANPDVNLDIGSSVHIEHATDWNPDGQTTVRYRGADWSAELAPGQQAAAGSFVIEQVRGSVLVLRRA
jgi:membrane protein implicated in regulation of membrane protease activity